MKKIFFLIIAQQLFFFAESTPQPANKIAVFIVGAPRSGTSATAGVLKILGLQLGDDLVGPLPDNQKGHFEDAQIVAHNRALYKALGSKNTYTGMALPDAWFQSNNGYKAMQETKVLLHKRFATYRCFGIKNPLLSLFLPTYFSAVKSLFYIPKLIIVIRNPLEIAYSIQRRTNLALEHILNVVTNYLTSIYRYSVSVEKLVILFDDLLYNTKHVLTKMVEFLPALSLTHQKEKEINEFLDQSLKHHDHTRSKKLTASEQQAYARALEAYNKFC